ERRQCKGWEVEAVEVGRRVGALGYRFTDGSDWRRGLVYVADNELSRRAKCEDKPDWRKRFVEFARGAASLVHDTMCTAGEYESFIGWGHSTHEDTVDLAIEAEVEQLVLFHHRPERTADELARCVEE